MVFPPFGRNSERRIVNKHGLVVEADISFLQDAYKCIVAQQRYVTV